MTAIILTASYIAIVHSLVNPSHYAPFVALGKSRGWGLAKTSLVAAFCGLGHLVGFLLLLTLFALLGENFNLRVVLAEYGESFGAWLLLAFGVVYFIFGLLNARKNFIAKSSLNFSDCHACGTCSTCIEKFVPIAKFDFIKSKSVWGLFLIFMLSPCDAAIAFIFLPVTTPAEFAITALVFFTLTILTMLLVTALLFKGVSLFKFKGNFFSLISDALTGLVIILAALYILVFHE